MPLLGAAFVFGLLHALLPGHGKAVLTARYAGSGRLAGALASSAIVMMMQVGTAIILVLTMAIGSIVGTFIGGRLLGIGPSNLLLPALALILVVSAVKVSRHR